MPQRLLIVNRRLALPRSGRRIVLFDPATGAGAGCCCDPVGPCGNVCGSPANEIGRCPGGTVCSLDTTTGAGVEATRWRFDFSGSGSTITAGFPTTTWAAQGSVELGWVVEGTNCVFRLLAAQGTATFTAGGNPPLVTQLGVPFWTLGGIKPVLYLNQFRLKDFADAVTAGNLAAFGTFTAGLVSPCNLTYTEGSPPDQVRWTRTYASTCGGGALSANFTTIPVASYRGSIAFTCGITLLEGCGVPKRSCDEWRALWLAQDPAADLNGDGYVDAIDLDEIVRRYCV